MFVNCEQTSVPTIFTQKFYSADLVKAKTTIPLTVGEQCEIYTTLRVSVYDTTIYLPFDRGIVVYY